MTGARFIMVGAASAALAVAFGAFGAHALKTRLPADLLTIWHTGFQYHLAHSLGLILVGLACLQWPDSKWIIASGWLMLAGMLLFSGSLYLLALSGIRGFGMITPLGGIAFIIAWISLAVAAWANGRVS